jgi:hypothetical protein
MPQKKGKSGGTKKPSKPKKQTSDRVSKLASDVLAGRKNPTKSEIKTLAASALGQDETKGTRKPKPKKPE